MPDVFDHIPTFCAERAVRSARSLSASPTVLERKVAKEASSDAIVAFSF
jgi:hypothetical protein